MGQAIQMNRKQILWQIQLSTKGKLLNQLVRAIPVKVLLCRLNLGTSWLLYKAKAAILMET